MSERIHAQTTFGELAVILTARGASITADLEPRAHSERRFLVTLTTAESTASGSGFQLHEATDMALQRLDALRGERLSKPAAAPASLIATRPPPFHPTDIECSVCKAKSAAWIAATARDPVKSAFVTRVSLSPWEHHSGSSLSSRLVMLCNTIDAVTGDAPVRMVDGIEYHEARVRDAERASVGLANSVECDEFLCLPERNPSHYVVDRHRPIRGRND